MKTPIAIAALIVAGSAYAQQQQPRFTTCSQVAEFAKQQCTTTYRPVMCQNNIEQNRAACLTTGTYQAPSRPPITNLRKE